MTTINTADLLALLDLDPAAGVLAVADLRERRAKAATPGRWYAIDRPRTLWDVESVNDDEPEGIAVAAGDIGTGACVEEDAKHIAAEANPAHALAAVRRWKKTVERHTSAPLGIYVKCRWCITKDYPCADLTETADEARAYLGGAAS